MGLKALKLPVSILTDLYPKGLIAGEGLPAIEENVAVTSIIQNNVDETGIKEEDYKPKFLGNNKRNILILVHNPGIPYLEDADLTFLTNMLTACKLSLSDVAIINTAGQNDFSYKKEIAALQSSIIMLTGPSPSELGMPVDFPHFQVQPFNGLTFLSSPPLSEIKNDPLQKSKLWVCLRRIFHV